MTDTSSPTGMNDELDEIVGEFLAESQEALDGLNANFVALEHEPHNVDRLNSIFRAVHTIKGTSGFLAFAKLEEVAHAAENLLSCLRDQALVLNADSTSTLLLAVDALQDILRHIEQDGTEGDRDDSSLVAALERLAVRDQPLPSAEPGPVPAGRAAQTEPAAPEKTVTAAPEKTVTGAPENTVTAAPEKSEPPTAEKSEPPAVALGDGRTAGADNHVRIDIGLLDRLMDLVGELVLARNQLLQYTVNAGDNLASTSQRMNLITTELQEGVMKTRMQPIDSVWSRFPRTVRDLALACGKQVALELEGRDTELDRTVIESVRDPLTHLVRNAIDHGIETPGERLAAGKPAEGRLVLRAFHEGGRVNIEVLDDGAGIDVERVRAKAAANGTAADKLASMTERELLELVFLPGFSTAEAVTNVSGRGVGMDVVKTNIEKIGGTVELASKIGHGTSVKVKIPLTLAIIPALIITSSHERYAIPQVSLLELVTATRDQLDYVADAPVYRLRGRLLPLVDLAGQLGTERADPQHNVTIVVLQADGKPFGLVVDEVHDTEDIVVKPLGRRLKHISAFSGATIMGDGRVALILDVLGLAQGAGIAGDGNETAATADDAEAAAAADGGTETLLLLAAGAHHRLAIPLSKVNRIEEVPIEDVEKAGRGDAVQYRGQIMPLVYVAEVLGDPRLTSGVKSLPVVVYKAGDRPVGLVVDEIIDTVDDLVMTDARLASAGTLSSAIVAGQITELLDVEAMTAAFATSAPAAAGHDNA